MSPVDPPRGSSHWAAHSRGDDKFIDWGATFGAADLTQLWGIGFSFGEGEPFDVWIDDVSFLK
ncbi:hypothetical protein WME89_34210 [Sorangium sp. So ce321]|uniref:hypothetical protein n=1 Tax=Sorangium sp. So ce321 TaxID=3133300 RepID=UPI003F5DD4FF